MTRMMRLRLIAASLALSALSCAEEAPQIENYSFAPAGGAVVTHIDLILNVDFDREILDGTALLDIDNPNGADKLYLDTWALVIESVGFGSDGPETPWTLGDSLALVGRPLIIDIAPGTNRVRVQYHTGADARGVQWLQPAQTLGGRHPFLYTQSQAILARSWIPLQDTPAVRMTYDATVHVPPGLMAVMSAENPTGVSEDGSYRFAMPQPIPSYLMALGVGEFAFRELGPRTGI